MIREQDCRGCRAAALLCAACQKIYLVQYSLRKAYRLKSLQGSRTIPLKHINVVLPAILIGRELKALAVRRVRMSCGRRSMTTSIAV